VPGDPVEGVLGVPVVGLLGVPVVGLLGVPVVGVDGVPVWGDVPCGRKPEPQPTSATLAAITIHTLIPRRDTGKHITLLT